jgi:putative NADH-flavin reductase
MNILVVGATGGTGVQLVEQGLNRGHAMVALARRPDAIGIVHPRLRVAAGNVIDRDSLEAAMNGVEAVVSSLGVGGLLASRKTGSLLSQGTANLLAAMRAVGVERLVAISSVGVDDDPTEGFVYRRILKPLFLKNLYIDMRRMETAVAASDRDWTLVRPPLLLDKPATGKYRIEVGGNVPGARIIPRADLAAFVLDLAETGAHSRERVGICQ